MSKRVPTRAQLLHRWRSIEEDENDEAAIDTVDSSISNRIRKEKEHWFSDAYNFLICLPRENHIWCGFWDIMSPLLETFYNYLKVGSRDSPLKVLWERISLEMRQCIHCISRHHQAQEMYRTEYESSLISPLLSILQKLDEERVAQHLREVNARIAEREYDPARDSAEIVSVMFEVLTFPFLLDDECVANEFQSFIEAVDDAHELTLANQQRFPGVYALLFSKSRKARSIGLRLAGKMEKLRCAEDLGPLQPLLKRCINFLATEAMQPNTEISRPRVQLERMTVWLGLKALLGFVEPAALEEGILEPYPVFLNFVLDHISDDSPEFSHAVNCMRLLFEIMGCKLWLRTSLPPSVMRDSLLSQCFHTRNEKTHKEIFDLFQPLLQSLEPLQDGEFERQRRHLLYFLLHQVTRSSNFSLLMRKKACQIALLIVLRGYKMNPATPPAECAHMWGPSLVSSLKDFTLHTSLRQPAVDLFQTIIVSDATALVASMLHSQSCSATDNLSAELIEDIDDVLPYALPSEEKSISSWHEFWIQSKTISQEYTDWMCVPMLWIDVLVEIEPVILPISISKAVLWALSRFSMIEPESNAERSLPVKTWLSSTASEVSAYIGWKSPIGSDDGGAENPSKNSVMVSTLCIPLIRTLRRLAAHFVVEVERGELQKRWTWEPRMGESLILLLADPNDNVRQVGRRSLERVSNTRGLASGLQFLCATKSSLAAIFLGLRHALKLVQLDPVLLYFQSLHHFFFVLCKIFREGFLSNPCLPGNSSDDPNVKLSSQGGFLWQPILDSLAVNDSNHLSVVEKKSWDSFCFELAKIAWPSVKKCLLEGKAFIDCRISQMTCVRLLETIPLVLENLDPSSYGLLVESGNTFENKSEFNWLHDLVDWGKSSHEAVVRYWKQSLSSLLTLLKRSCNDKAVAAIGAVEKILSHDAVPMDSLAEHVSRLSVSLSVADKSCQHLRHSGVSMRREYSPLNKSPSLNDADMQVLDSTAVESKKDTGDVVMLSDDETENVTSPSGIIESDTEQTKGTVDTNILDPIGDKGVLQVDVGNRTSHESRTLKESSGAIQETVGTNDVALTSISDTCGARKQVLASASLRKSKDIHTRQEIYPKAGPHKISLGKAISKKSMDETVTTNQSASARATVVSGKKDIVMKKLVPDAEDPLELALKSAERKKPSLTKQISSLPKRQVIQLMVSEDNGPGYLRKMETGAQRFKPPKLDDWFRPILEIDYFATVGLASSDEGENKNSCEFKEVPVSFQSPQQYVEIFRPFVLEEFKAQLRSSFQELSSLEEMSCGSVSVVSIERIDEFHLVRCVHDGQDLSSSSICLENDLVLLTKQPLRNSSPNNIHIVGKIERREKDNKRRQNILVIRFYLQSSSMRLNRSKKLLLVRSKWFLNRIMSVTSQLREFRALSSIEVIPALPIILEPTYNSRAHSQGRSGNLGKLSQPLQRLLKSTFNESQLQAIGAVIGSSDSKNDFDLSLVQGPPGTGKTRTIVAIISALLAMSSSRTSCSGIETNVTSSTASRTRINESAAIARAWQDAALARQLNSDAEWGIKSGNAFMKRRVLVCAQSNAAVDELVSRLAGEGLYSVDGNMYKPYIVRVGNAKTIHPNSLPFFIDTLVDHRLAEERVSDGGAKNELNEDSSTTLRSSLEKIVERIKFYESKRANLKDGASDKKSSSENDHFDMGEDKSSGELEAKLRILYAQKKEIYMKLAATQAREKKNNEETRALRNKLRRTILREAEIVVTTLSGCGGDLYAVCSESVGNCRSGNVSEQNLFDAVVIDEAAQALEPATLIPFQLLKSSGTKCIMVGDPKQLPATVLSNVASRYLFECSMFERLQRAGRSVIMLALQYRMHPEICRFPSLHFYGGKLLNGVKVSCKTAPFHRIMGLGPYVFYDVVDGQELHGKNSGASSLYNEAEADAAVEILGSFKNRYPSEFSGGRIGIITPYKSQLSLLRSRFSGAFGSSITSEIEFNTVDGFQGREVDILILSTVRASDLHSVQSRKNWCSIGFVADVRRMNVALTRARLSLWILGNARTLQRNSDWAALIKDAKERNLVISVKKPYRLAFERVFAKSSNFEGYTSGQESLSEKYERTIQHARKNEGNSEQTCERKYNSIDNEAPGEKRREGKEHSVTVVKEGSSNSGTRLKEGINSTKTKPALKGEGTECSEKKQTSVDAHKSKRKTENTMCMDHYEQERDQTHNVSKARVSGGHRSPVKHQKSQKGGDHSVLHVNRKLQGKGINNRAGAPAEIEAPKGLIAKRKQQRDAVDALLSSALISSKKSETSSKSLPPERPLLSSSNAGGAKPTKRQRASDSETEMRGHTRGK